MENRIKALVEQLYAGHRFSEEKVAEILRLNNSNWEELARAMVIATPVTALEARPGDKCALCGGKIRVRTSWRSGEWFKQRLQCRECDYDAGVIAVKRDGKTEAN